MRPRTTFLDVTLIAIATVAAVVRPSQGFLDTGYANGFYPAAQTWMTTWTNRVPFAVADLILIVVLCALLAHWVLALRASPRWSVALRLVVRTLAIIGVVYVWFLVDWGWNYDRPSLGAILGYRAPDVSRADLEPLEIRMATALDDAAIRAHRAHDANPDSGAALAEAQRATLARIGIAHDVVRTRPKRTMFDPYFVATGVSGMFVPFTYETYMASDLLWFEYPFALEHEWGHVSGIARESDANFVAALATLDSDDEVLHYSGLLIVYAAMPRIPRADAHLSKLVLGDYAAMRRRDQRHIKPLAFKVAWGAYDTYLKSQHVRSGVVNYTEYVRLLFGTGVGRDALAHALR